MTAIESIIYDYNEGATIRMDNGVDLPAQALTPLANTVCARDEIYDANMYLEAAWNAAHPIPETITTIPASTPLITRGPEGIIASSGGYDFAIDARIDGEVECRTFMPLHEPKPEPWETAEYCHANGNFYKRLRNEHGTYWRRTGSDATHSREDMAKLNPKPVTIGEA